MKKTDVVVIFNSEIFNMSEEGLRYLKNNIETNFKLYEYNNSGIRNVFNEEYSKGCRYFILNITTEEILNIQDIIRTHQDVDFVSSTSTASSIRNIYPNLYFTSATISYIDIVVKSLLALSACLVYDNASDIFIMNVVTKFEENNFVTININNPNISNIITQFSVIVMVSTQRNIFNQVFNITRVIDANFNYYSLELTPEDNIILPPNTSSFTIIYPLQTAYPQLESYWNINAGSKRFDAVYPAIGILPVLINIEKNEKLCSYQTEFINNLKKLSIISNKLVENGIVYSGISELSPVTLRYNLKNKFKIRNKQIIWLIDLENMNSINVYNATAIKFNIPRIKKIIYTNNFIGNIEKYKKKSYQIFILSGTVQRLLEVKNEYEYNNNLKFICPLSTYTPLRSASSNFLFMLMNDITMVIIRFVIAKIVSNNKFVAVIGDDASYPDLKNIIKTLNQYEVPTFRIDDINKIPKDTVIIYTIGKNIYHRMLTIIKNNKNFLPSLKSVRSYGEYITLEEYIIATELGYTADLSIIPYNSGQPFLDSTYSKNSKYDWLDPQTNFKNLSNVLFYFDIEFLFKFGYIIDI